MTAERRARQLLALGAAAGLAVAATALVGARAPHAGLPEGAIATVNGELVRADDYARALAALAADRRDPLGEDDRRRVLDRLVDEELLVQRALELGLARRDRLVRAELAGAAIGLLGTTADAPEPTRAELEAFYDAHRDDFTEPGRIRVEQVFVGAASVEDEARAGGRAAAAARRLRAGDALAGVRRDLGDEEVAPPPDALLPPAKLREYLGETATRAALALTPGGVSDPVRSGAGFHVLRVVEREAARVPPFDEIVDAVRAQRRRRGDEEALRTALDSLRRRADVRVAERLP